MNITVLGAAVAGGGWDGLLPAHRGTGHSRPTGGPVLRDALGLGDGLILAVVADATNRLYPAPLLADTHGIRRAQPGDGAAEALLHALATRRPDGGRFSLTSWHAEPCRGESTFGVDQTNESVIVGDRAVVKWMYQAEPGPHPAPRLLRALVRADFGGMPPPWGFVQWQASDDEEARLLASADTLLPQAEDGWTWAVSDLRQATTANSTVVVRNTGRRLGGLIAGMHSAFGKEQVPATSADLAALQDAADRDLAEALAHTNGYGRVLLTDRVGTIRRVTRVPATCIGLPLAPVHGDLHVGQILRTSESGVPEYFVTDFDGSPVVPAAERVRPQPPAFDVASLVQSIQHADFVLRRHESWHDRDLVTSMADAFIDAFLAAYAATVAPSQFNQQALVNGFRLRQVCREFTYAATHLPRWSYIPEMAFAALLPLPHSPAQSPREER